MELLLYVVSRVNLFVFQVVAVVLLGGIYAIPGQYDKINCVCQVVTIVFQVVAVVFQVDAMTSQVITMMLLLYGVSRVESVLGGCHGIARWLLWS